MVNQTWDRVAAIEETAVSDDGYVEVTVDARGAVLALVLDPRVYRDQDPDALAARIVATAETAAESARARAFGLLKPLLPPRSSVEDVDLGFDPVLHHLAGRR